MLTNQYLDELFDELKIEGETYFYYFYTMKMASTSEYFKLGFGALLENEHQIICFTNKRIMLLEITPLQGKFNGNKKYIDMKDVESVKVKRGWFKTKITVTLTGNRGDIVIKSNSFTIGLSNQRKNLISLEKMYD
ncbi:PH domain-containing protein [Bacillus bingmayongensis]|uniref:PH domain-containing protein n=1 Tax=Bacillus bingmayongensis TaxID=1150157 RepID=UPI0002F0DF37|nr:PH domain-containing protein [Bacillus bingmayongensis]MBY0599205.1 PH domain-containing protein [Bacillus bingmayongensis]